MSESFCEAMQRIQTLPGTSAEEVERLDRALLDMATGEHTTREIEPGIYEHTFTPPYWHTSAWSEAREQTAPISLDTLSRALHEINAYSRTYPEMLYVSVEDTRRIRHFYRLGQMYRAHPIPRRKLRKCHMRKVQQHWRAGRAHIQRVEQAEQAREEAAMQRLRGNQ